MTDAQNTGVVELADRLWQAAVDRRPIEPLTRRPARPDGARRLRDPGAQRPAPGGGGCGGPRTPARAAPRGARQAVLGVDEPDFGVLLDDMFLDEGDDIPVELFVQPRVVASWPSSWATDLAGPGVTVADALTAVAGVMPAIEVVDSRIADWQVQVADTVADNASAGKVVLGGRITPVDRGRPAPGRGAALPQRVGDRERRRRGRPRQPGTLRRVAGERARLGRSRAAPRRHRAGRAAAPAGAGPAGRLLPGRVRPPGERDGAVRRRSPA